MYENWFCHEQFQVMLRQDTASIYLPQIIKMATRHHNFDQVIKDHENLFYKQTCSPLHKHYIVIHMPIHSYNQNVIKRPRLI